MRSRARLHIAACSFIESLGEGVKLKIAGLSQLKPHTKLLIATSGLFSVSFLGIQMLLKVLYMLRLDFGTEYIGWFLASSSLAYMSMGLPSGALGARYGPRRIMIVGGLISTLGVAVLPLTEYVPLWLRDTLPMLSQVAATAGWSMLSVNIVPTLTAMSSEQTRNQAFSLNAVLQGAGTFLGTFVGGLMPGWFASLLGQSLDGPGPYRYALWVGAILSGLAITPLLFSGPIEVTATGSRQERRGSFPIWPIVTTFIYVYVRHAGWATGRAFWNAYMDTDLHLSTAWIGGIASAGQAVAILAPLINPWLARHRSNGWIAMVSTLGVALSLLPLLIPHWVAAAISQMIFVVVSAIWLPAVQSFQMERVDPEWRSIGYGAVAMAMGSGFSSMSIAGGYIVAAAGYRSLFGLGIAISLVATAIMWGILRHAARGPVVPTQEPAS
jgi:MFS family permease